MRASDLKKIIPRALQPAAVMPYRAWRRLQYRYQTRNVRINPRPIIVLGNQKSGTSAIAALLSEMTGLSAAIDLQNEIGWTSYPLVVTGKMEIEGLIQRNKVEFSRQIIKEPNLTLLYPQLAGYFPEARFVFVIRDPRDNIRSILNRLKLPGNLEDLSPAQWQGLHPAWKLIVDCRWMGFEADGYIEMMARRWDHMAGVFLDHQDRFTASRFESFLADKVAEIRRLARELGLDPARDISDKVDVQFQPAGDRSVRWRDFFGPDNLAKIEKICREKMRALGYD